MKLVNNALFAAQVGLVTEAIGLARQLGIDEQTLLDTLPHASASCRALASVAAQGSISSFNSKVGEFLSKDVAAVRMVADQLGADLGALDTAIEVAAEAW